MKNPLASKSSFITLLFISFLWPALLGAQNSQPRFFVNNECQIISPNKDLNAWASKLSPGWDQGLKPVHTIDLPPKFAKTHALPLLQSTAYVFYDSNFICPPKVNEVFLKYNGERGWSLNYGKNDLEYRTSRENINALNDGTDVFCDGDVDLQKLQALNAHNDEFMANNTLALKQMKELTVEIIRNGFFQPRDASLTTDGETVYNLPEVQREIAAGRWKPDAFPVDQVKYTHITFCVGFPKENTLVAVLQSALPDNKSSFIICRTVKGLIFYPFDVVGSRVQGSFDQIINWFGDDYIVFYWRRQGAAGKTVYQVTEEGLKAVTQSVVKTD